jgi:hypothetical protein
VAPWQRHSGCEEEAGLARLRCVSGCVVAAAVGSALGTGSLACNNQCVEHGNIVLHETLAHSSEPCTLTVSGSQGTATYSFAAWSGSEVQCVVVQGPTPDACVRDQGGGYAPLNDDDTPAFGAVFGTVDEFIVLFSGDPNAVGARSFFGDDDVYATLTCSSSTVEAHQLRHFQCIKGG